MPAEIPARTEAEVGKQRIDAGINLRLPRFVLNLSRLDMDDVENIPLNLPELRTTAGNLLADGSLVAPMNKQHKERNRHQPTKNCTFHGFSSVTPASGIYSIVGDTNRPEAFVIIAPWRGTNAARDRSN